MAYVLFWGHAASLRSISTSHLGGTVTFSSVSYRAFLRRAPGCPSPAPNVKSSSFQVAVVSSPTLRRCSFLTWQFHPWHLPSCNFSKPSHFTHSQICAQVEFVFFPLTMASIFFQDRCPAFIIITVFSHSGIYNSSNIVSMGSVCASVCTSGNFLFINYLLRQHVSYRGQVVAQK